MKEVFCCHIPQGEIENSQLSVGSSILVNNNFQSWYVCRLYEKREGKCLVEKSN